MPGTTGLKFDYIFILTYGRSGSTLLQGILNTIPGVLVRGENAAALRGLFYSWRTLNTTDADLADSSRSPTSPWFGLSGIDTEAYGRTLAKLFVDLVLRPEHGTVMTGFKEIRYSPNEAPVLDEELDFMRHFFARAAFIINTRNIDDVIESSRNAGHGYRPEDLKASDKRLRAIAAKEEPDVFHVHYDNYVGDPSGLAQLFTFLGADFSADAIKETLRRPHSTSTRN